jgi:hypothetical protein
VGVNWREVEAGGRCSQSSSQRRGGSLIGSSLIAWKTKKQTVVSRSSAEAELHAFACVTVEVTWLRWLLADFCVALSSTSVHCDSTGAISIA